MKEALLSPPISSTYSAVSLNGADSNPILPPGVLPGMGRGRKGRNKNTNKNKNENENENRNRNSCENNEDDVKIKELREVEDI